MAPSCKIFKDPISLSFGYAWYKPRHLRIKALHRAMKRFGPAVVKRHLRTASMMRHNRNRKIRRTLKSDAHYIARYL